MVWTVEFKRSAERQLAALDPPVQRRILRFLRDRVAPDTDPRRLARRLRGDGPDLWRFRVGDYRLICSLQDQHLHILVLIVAHRRRVYSQRR